MAQRGRPGLSHDLKQEVWRRWRSGESLSDIARAVNSQPGSIFGILRLHGGISPAKRCRAENSLTLSEREEISRGLSAGKSMRAIATDLRRSPSTISREIARNGGAQRYRANQADEKAWDRARRPKLCLLALNGRLRRTVAEKLALDWSPEQISGWLKRTFSDDENMYVSHETIYRSIYIQARGVLKKELQKHLRTQRIFRQSRYNNLRGIPRGKIVDAVSISERPPEIEDRAIPGHWEGDLIAGSANTHIATLVERKSRFAMLIKVTGKDINTVVSAISRHIKRLPVELRQSVTWDRGSEMANHKDFTVATDAKVYFCDPSSPWQRGTNENTNRLLRQYFPKKTDLSVYTQRELSQVAKKLNQRPRKVLDFQTPADTLQQCVARTD
ncbi:MAG: IS30 family transposase [Candidatus Thiodiazotropha endolucinida]